MRQFDVTIGLIFGNALIDRYIWEIKFQHDKRVEPIWTKGDKDGIKSICFRG